MKVPHSTVLLAVGGCLLLGCSGDDGEPTSEAEGTTTTDGAAATPTTFAVVIDDEAGADGIRVQYDCIDAAGIATEALEAGDEAEAAAIVEVLDAIDRDVRDYVLADLPERLPELVEACDEAGQLP